MKKIASFTSSYFPTMEKHASSTPLGTSNKNPMKRTVIRKNRHKKHSRKDLMFNNVVSYLISDCYMYSPLVSSQPTFDFPPPTQIVTPPGVQEDAALPIKGRNKKLFEKVVDYLEADCYLYSPLITTTTDKHHVCSTNHATITTSGGEIPKGGVGELSRQLHARPAVKKTYVAYRETVKHSMHGSLGNKKIE